VHRLDETTNSRRDHSTHDKRRTALIVVAVLAGLVLVGALHLLGVTPHGG
jgi:hypothetical protein